jgi:hypothetical protein
VWCGEGKLMFTYKEEKEYSRQEIGAGFVLFVIFSA